MPELESVQPSIKPTPLTFYTQHRWACLISIMGVVLSLIAILIHLHSSQPRQKVSNQTHPIPQSSASSKPLVDASYFTSLPVSLLYYSFSQTYNSRGIFQSDPTDISRRVLDLPYPDATHYLTSPSGKSILRWSPASIDLIASIETGATSKIFTPHKDEKITAVYWSPNKDKIAYSTQTDSSDPAGFGNIYTTKIYSQNLTQPSQLVSTASHLYTQKLYAYPNEQEVALVQESLGKIGHLQFFNIETKTLGDDQIDLDQMALLPLMRWTASMQQGYYFTSTQVFRYNLSSKTIDPLYTLNRHCPVGPDASSAIMGLSVAPSGSKVAVTTRLEPCTATSYKIATPGATASPIHKTSLVLLQAEKPILEQFDQPFTALNESHWSPDESFVWIKSAAETFYMLKPDQLSYTLWPDSERQTITKERPYFLGWLTH